MQYVIGIGAVQSTGKYGLSQTGNQLHEMGEGAVLLGTGARICCGNFLSLLAPQTTRTPPGVCARSERQAPSPRGIRRVRCPVVSCLPLGIRAEDRNRGDPLGDRRRVDL